MKNNILLKKIIVNSLTFSRVLATLFLPLLFNLLSSTAFFLVVGGILLTDAFDGFLARKWEVSTLFGSLLDMGADKLFGISLLCGLSLTYPIMILPLILELCISYVNTNNVLRGNVAKSKIIGKGKMWIVGLSMTSLLMIGATPEISEFISNVKVDVNLFKDFYEKLNVDSKIIHEFASYLDNIFSFIKEKSIELLNVLTKFFSNNNNTIKNISIPATIAAETATFIDYKLDSKKIENNEKLKMIEELKRYKEYIKNYGFKKYMNEIMFNKDYYDETINEPLVKKLMPNGNKRVDK